MKISLSMFTPFKIAAFVKVRWRRGPWRRSRGFTMMEVMFVLAIITTLVGLVFPLYVSYLEKARVARAIVEIRTFEKEIDLYDFTKGVPPDSLAEAGIGITPDPWGSPYEYLKINCVEDDGSKKGKGASKCKAPKGARMDKFLRPINSDYDLYSMGKNRESKKPLQSSKSRDDVVRANDGAFIGLATDF